MLLSEVYLPQFIKVDLAAEDKDEVFEELVDHFCMITNSAAREDILTSLREREAKMSTGIEHGIAIPHGKTSAVERVFGVLGVSKNGIEYNSLDGKPVFLVMMILAPPVEAEKHLHLLQRMAEVLRNPDFYTDVLAATTPDAIYNVIKKYEDGTTFSDYKR
jgi:PTS system fructose-specific IIC component/PTS system nitrogen regulatory IIA component